MKDVNRISVKAAVKYYGRSVTDNLTRNVNLENLNQQEFLGSMSAVR